MTILDMTAVKVALADVRVLVANEQRSGWIWSPAPVNADIYAVSRQAALEDASHLSIFASDTDDGAQARCPSLASRYLAALKTWRSF